MEPWCKIATPRKEVHEGRSFNPDEFAIARHLGEGGRELMIAEYRLQNADLRLNCDDYNLQSEISNLHSPIAA